MIQVGIEPLHLFEKIKQNEISTVVSNIPMYKGMSIYVAEAVRLMEEKLEIMVDALKELLCDR